MVPGVAGGQVSEALPLEEVRRLVEKAATSEAVRLEVSPEKGRHLVARRPLRAGELFLAEWPIFQGGPAGKSSRKACEEAFVARADEEEVDGDCLHPCSSLVDCVAGILLAKQRALGLEARDHVSEEEEEERRERQEAAALRLRQLASLSQAHPLSDTAAAQAEEDQMACARSLMGVLRPELQALTSEAELVNFLKTLSNNRFGSADAQLDLMFAGSMFEHSCAPNAFVAGAWRAPLADKPREYRTLRDVEVGEALSIDYIALPNSYLGAESRAELLAGWGFTCSCPRCTTQPELTRAFMCPACSMPELCPSRPARPPPAPGEEADEGELVCRACGQAAEASYASRCLRAEAALRRCSKASTPEDAEEAQANASSFEGVLSRFHYAAFVLVWASWTDGPDLETQSNVERLEDYLATTEQVLECLTRLCGGSLHPQLLQIYHARALLAHGDLNAQRYFLDLERKVLQRFYPEEANLQDSEIMHMVSRHGPPGATDAATDAEPGDSGSSGGTAGDLPALLPKASVGDTSEALFGLGLPQAMENWGLSDMD